MVLINTLAIEDSMAIISQFCICFNDCQQNIALVSAWDDLQIA